MQSPTAMVAFLVWTMREMENQPMARQELLKAPADGQMGNIMP